MIEPKNCHILVCSLGASWAVVPEVFGFLAPEVLPLYRHHPAWNEIATSRQEHALQPPQEVWLLTTAGKKALDSLRSIETWWEVLGKPCPLRVWIAAETDQLATPSECRRIRELTLRVVLHARHRAGNGQVVLSLAGGRKTMSADLQMAGTLLGAHAWLHVVGPEPLPPELRDNPDPTLFALPLPKELAAAVRPLVVGRGRSDDLLDVPLNGRRIDPKHFPLPLTDAVLEWGPEEGEPWLTDEIERRQQAGSQLLLNFFASIRRDHAVPTWPGLLRLSPRIIETLRSTTTAAEHQEFLRRLPKVDLHRHLGGCLDVSAQRRVARAIWEATCDDKRATALDGIRWLLVPAQPWPWNWPDQLRGSLRAEMSAALLLYAHPRQLERGLYTDTEPRVALKGRHPRGFAAYERPGDLSGSALLCHEAAWHAYATELVAAAKAEGLLALELRGSPHKYVPEDPVRFVHALRQALAAAGACVDGLATTPGEACGPRIGFIWILDRRKHDGATEVIQHAVRARQELPEFVLGLDLAGDESDSRPQEWAPLFEPAFRECLFVTVHAGEDEPAENIWEAAYHLHADRIGHGLTLHDNPRLQTRFRDRGVCLELCPSSNIEVVGFHDPTQPATAGLPPYPLRTLLNAELPVTLCTDNPAISRTTLANEYVVASRITPGGLSLWEALGLIRQGFERSFFPAQDRQALLDVADAAVVQAVIETFGGDAH